MRSPFVSAFEIICIRRGVLTGERPAPERIAKRLNLSLFLTRTSASFWRASVVLLLDGTLCQSRFCLDNPGQTGQNESGFSGRLPLLQPQNIRLSQI